MQTLNFIVTKGDEYINYIFTTPDRESVKDELISRILILRKYDSLIDLDENTRYIPPLRAKRYIIYKEKVTPEEVTMATLKVSKTHKVSYKNIGESQKRA